MFDRKNADELQSPASSAVAIAPRISAYSNDTFVHSGGRKRMSIDVHNPGTKSIPALILSVVPVRTVECEANMFWPEISSSKFDLAAGEHCTTELTYPFPSQLPASTYFLWMMLWSSWPKFSLHSTLMSFTIIRGRAPLGGKQLPKSPESKVIRL